MLEIHHSGREPSKFSLLCFFLSRLLLDMINNTNQLKGWRRKVYFSFTDTLLYSHMLDSIEFEHTVLLWV